MNGNNVKPEIFERINCQLENLHEEISILSKKNPDGAINKFKIEFINIIIDKANDFLKEEYIPLVNFKQFDVEMLPSNSDVVFILSQYISCMEQYKVEHIEKGLNGIWHWKTEKSTDKIITTSSPKIRI